MCKQQKGKYVSDLWSRPWRAIFSWWFSVSRVKHIEALSAIHMGNKWYEPTCKSECEIKNAQFLSDFRDLIWISYRKDFTCLSQCPQIPARYHTYRSDSGWGCMIRYVFLLTYQSCTDVAGKLLSSSHISFRRIFYQAGY